MGRWFSNGDTTFWSRPDGVSIIDVLAVSFSGAYLYLVVMGIRTPEAYHLAEIQSNMNMAITTILGGYFGDQIVQHFNKPKEMQMQIEKNKRETI